MSALRNLVAENKTNHDCLISRDKEITTVIETLMRVDKPNVIITGEAGVGKTALVNHIAYMIANDLVPNELKGYGMSEINLNDLIAGEGYRGVFEKKCQDMLTAACAKPKTIIFIDEIHSAENLGKMQGGQTPGFGNTLKPYLTKGNIRIIGATTNDEYNKIEDKAFLRRFRRIQLNEPDEATCFKIFEKSLPKYNIRKVDIDIDTKNFFDKIYSTSQVISGCNPDKLIDVIDILFAKTRLYNNKTLTDNIIDNYVEDIIETKMFSNNSF